MDLSLRLSYGCVEDGVRGFLAFRPRKRESRKSWGQIRERRRREAEEENQVEEERCAVFLTMDRVDSSILATIQPLYKYCRESPLVPVALWCARLRAGLSSSLPAYYSTRFVISPSLPLLLLLVAPALTYTSLSSFLPLFFFLFFLSNVSSSFLPSLTSRKLRSGISVDIGVKTNNETARERQMARVLLLDTVICANLFPRSALSGFIWRLQRESVF